MAPRSTATDSTSRRSMLKTTGGLCAVGLSALAGCTGGGDGNGDGGDGGGDGGDGSSGLTVPEYANWIPTADAFSDGVLYAHSQWAEMPSMEDGEDGPSYEGLNLDTAFEGEGETTATSDQTVVQLSFGAYAVMSLGIGFGMGQVGLGDLFNEESDEDYGSTLETVTMVDSAYVLGGSFDTDAIGSRLEAEDAFKAVFAESDTAGGYTFYGAEGSAETVAVAEETLVVSLAGENVDDPEAVARHLVDTANGDAQRLHEADDDMKWAMSEAGTGHVVAGIAGELDNSGSGDQQPETVFESTDGAVNSLTMTDSEATSTLAATFPEGESPSSDDLDSEFSDAVGSITTDVTASGHVVVDGTWQAE